MITTFLVIYSCIMIVQGIATLYLMLYAWNNPEKHGNNSATKSYCAPKYSFSALIPARHEDTVIADTVNAVTSIQYPGELKETIIICSEDDRGTIDAARKVKLHPSAGKVRIIVIDADNPSKPKSLNAGLLEASGDVIAVFDAEDEPNPAIYSIINTVMVREKVQVVQSGVQLINHQSRWFSLLNVLEYYFWFKSFLHFFARHGLVPLGGNTVFFKSDLIKEIDGWDTKCLTEDADIGIRLCLNNSRVKILYDEKYVTREETPKSVGAFIKQRTRWNQGFLQILLKRQYLRWSSPVRSVLALLVLIWPIAQSLFLFILPLAIFTLSFEKVPVWLALFANIPTYILFVQLTVLSVGLYEFTRSFNLSYRWYFPITLTLTFFPYQLILGISALRAVYHVLISQNVWEKTDHFNLHRHTVEPTFKLYTDKTI